MLRAAKLTMLRGARVNCAETCKSKLTVLRDARVN